MFCRIWHGSGAWFGYPIMKLGKCIRVMPMGVYGQPFEFWDCKQFDHKAQAQLNLDCKFFRACKRNIPLMWPIINEPPLKYMSACWWFIQPKFME